MPRIFIAFVCAFFLIATAAIAKEFSSVEEQMSSREFKSAGLDKLSPEELAALNAWIRTNQPSGVSYTARPTSEDPARIGLKGSEVRELITTNVIGVVKGFSGGTIFKMENGQTWQVDSGELAGIKAMTNPKVTIRPAIIGDGWRLQIEGYNTVAKVRRVE